MYSIPTYRMHHTIGKFFRFDSLPSLPPLVHTTVQSPFSTLPPSAVPLDDLEALKFSAGFSNQLKQLEKFRLF